MPLRVSTSNNFARLLAGLNFNQRKLVAAQAQTVSGKRVLRPSDDPVAAARSLSLTKRIADVGRFHRAISQGLTSVDTGSAMLGDAGQLLTNARELILQGMNGTLSQDDRDTIATELEVIRRELIDLANKRIGDSYLFGGTDSRNAPWREVTIDGLKRVLYDGNEEELLVAISDDVEIAANLAGSEVFGKSDPSGTIYAGLTGVSGGVTADEGTGYEYLELRHDSTDPGTIGGVGLALVAGGANDTLLGANTLTIDATAGTIQLGNGAVQNLPNPGSPAYADFAIENELGGELHLDFTGWTGLDFSGTVTGNGSISLDGTTYVPMTFGETDLELRHDATGAVIHVDTTAVLRAGSELVTFGGRVNVFDALEGVIEGLRNGDALDSSEVLQRLDVHLGQFDRGHDDVIDGASILGSRGARMRASDGRLAGVDLQLRSILSDATDADYAEVVVDLLRAEQTLQIAQATGVRLIQTTLLNFLG